MRRFRETLYRPVAPSDEPGRLLGFVLTAVAVGMATGVMAASFRVVLDWLTVQRHRLLVVAHGNAWAGAAFVTVVCAAAAATAAALVHRVEPHAEGSGIPRVEAVVEGRTPPGRARILPVKYVGGLIAMGAGLALGREGPSVQMGGNIGIIASRLGRRNRYDLRILVAAGAAAGLATAFSAPIAGGVFVLEELTKRFHPRTAVATLLASAAGFMSADVVLGGSYQVFRTAPMPDLTLAHVPAVVVVGLVTGVGGALYNSAIMRSLRIVDASRWPREARAALIGAFVGMVGFLGPSLIGGGDPLTQDALLGLGSTAAVIGVLAIRVVLGVISYAAATPGGIFAPMLVVGSHLGLLVGLVGQSLLPSLTPAPASLALIGMAAFFTATVRAPITGIVLATELTGVTNDLPPMLGACAVAMLMAQLMRSEPIYDALTTRAALAAKQNASDAAAERSEGSPA